MPHLTSRQRFTIALATVVCATLLGVTLAIAGCAEELASVALAASPILVIPWIAMRSERRGDE